MEATQKAYSSFVGLRDKDTGHEFSCIGGDSDMDKAKKMLVHDIAYYASIGREIVKAEIRTICTKCNNSGAYRKQGKYSFRYVNCPCHKQYEKEFITLV